MISDSIYFFHCVLCENSSSYHVPCARRGTAMLDLREVKLYDVVDWLLYMDSTEFLIGW